MGYLIILIIVVFAVYYIANDKKGKLEVFKRYNGEEKGIVNSIGDIRCFFDMRDEDEYTLDDQTWYDLNMDEVYRKIDRSYSSVGESVLYSMLRNPLINKEEIVERGKKIEAINDDIDSNISWLDVEITNKENGSIYFLLLFLYSKIFIISIVNATLIPNPIKIHISAGTHPNILLYTSIV